MNSTLYGQISQGRVTSTPRPGDLVFFDKNRNGQYGNDYDHTGIYVGRDAQGYRLIVHSSDEQRDTVKERIQSVSSWNNAPYIFVDVISYK